MLAATAFIIFIAKLIAEMIIERRAEIVEDLEVHRLVLGDDIYQQFSDATHVVRRMAEADPDERATLTSMWSTVRARLRELADSEFGLSQIHWRPQ